MGQFSSQWDSREQLHSQFQQLLSPLRVPLAYALGGKTALMFGLLQDDGQDREKGSFEVKFCFQCSMSQI